MTYEQLLHQLQDDTYVMLKPSPIHGIGVFAIKDIPQGCRTVFSKETGEWFKVSIEETEKLPAHSRNLIETYCLYDDQHYFVPNHGFKLMDISFYLNHSHEFNIVSLNEGEQFETLRDIKAGEELFVNYESIVEVEGY
jgi:SET domain-containing protein